LMPMTFGPAQAPRWHAKQRGKMTTGAGV
jgi:hypothetical protein